MVSDDTIAAVEQAAWDAARHAWQLSHDHLVAALTVAIEERVAFWHEIASLPPDTCAERQRALDLAFTQLLWDIEALRHEAVQLRDWAERLRHRSPPADRATSHARSA